MSRRIVVLGTGGREHALAWRLAHDPDRPEVFVAPGNRGMVGGLTTIEAPMQSEALLEACRRIGADLVVVGPEVLLADGVVDRGQAMGLTVFGPSSQAARLESSKWFAKQVMVEAGVPTARAEEFADVTEALAALDRFGPPWVVKADGLAAGKGVLVSGDRAETEGFVRDCLQGGRFGASGTRIVLEEFLSGEEASIMAVCDGERHVLLPPARDYKRAYDGDRGPNTGGMGSFAPTPSVTADLEAEVSTRIVTPILRTLAGRGIPYRGTLYVGLMLTPTGPRVIEFNVRFGDPETQSILPLVSGSLGDLFHGAALGRLDPGAVGRREGAAVTIALVDEGYPAALLGTGVIEGLDALRDPNLQVFHAGTTLEGAVCRVTGGRAAYVTALGATIAEAGERARAACATLHGHGWRFRRDIAAEVAVPRVNESR